MKSTAAATLILISFATYGDCVARLSLLDESEPRLFKFESCQLATQYLSATNHELSRFPELASNDLAVEVSPLSEVAATYMRNNEREFWHFKGSCSKLPLHKAVVLKTIEHCSDVGLTLNQVLGDITIEKYQLQK